MKHLRVLPLFLLAGLLLGLPGGTLYAQSSGEKKLDPAVEQAYKDLAAGVNPDNLSRHVRALSAIRSRVAGYPGAKQAAAYVENEFRKAGLQQVSTEEFEVTVPVSDGLRVEDLAAMAAKLQDDSTDPAGQYVRGRLSSETRGLVDACRSPLKNCDDAIARQEALKRANNDPAAIQEASVARQKAETDLKTALNALQPKLTDDLNEIAAGRSLWTSHGMIWGPIDHAAVVARAAAAAQKAEGTPPSPEEMREIEAAVKSREAEIQTLAATIAGGSGPRPVLETWAANATPKELTTRLNRLLIKQAFPGEVTILGAWLTIGNARYPLYPLWPNQVQTCKLPPPTKGGLKAPIIDVGSGSLSHFNGKVVDGSVVMVDFNSGQDWLNAPRLGAKAVLFVEPDSTQRGEAEGKFISIPLAIPRFWISRRDADSIRARYQLASARQPAAGDKGYLVPEAQLTSEVFWEKRTARNIVGRIEGTDPKLKNQVIAIESYYDSMSVVPDMAPGAEVACGVAAQLELARLYADPNSKYKPRRTVLFISTGAHHLALKGIRAYMAKHFSEYELPPVKVRFVKWLSSLAGSFHGVPLSKLLLTLLFGFCAFSIVRGLSKVGTFRKAFGAVGAALLVVCTLYFWTLSPQKEAPHEQLYVFTGLDLSSKTPRVGLFYKGMYYDFREDIQRKFADFARVQRENAEKIVKSVLGGDPKELFADGVNPISGKNWRNFIPGKMAMDHEAVTMAGAIGVGFVTTDDARPYVDTPFDTPEKVSIYNLAQQTRLLAPLYYNMFRDNNDPEAREDLALPITDPSNFSRMTLTGGFAQLKARVVEFDPRRSFIPDKEIPNGLAVVEDSDKSLMGVRGPLIEQVDEHGNVDFDGVAPLTAYGYNRATYLSAYHIDSATGDIDYAPDLGITGAKDYPLEQYITTGSKQATIVAFKCISTSLYDLVDPQMLRALTSLTVLDGKSNAEPRMYGYAVARPEAWISHIDDAAVIYSQPNTRIKVLMGSGPISTRFVLINSTPANPEGEGYATTASGSIANTAYKVAKDMWNMDEYRIRRLAKYRIINEGLNALHYGPEGLKAGQSMPAGARVGAKQELEAAEAAQKALDYEAFDAHSRAAWGYESRAYPDVQQTAQDVVKGVLFYLWLLLPFSFFMERLLWGFSDLRRQLLAALSVFVVIFVILLKVHPAFEITMNPLIVLLAFIMLALALMIIILVIGKFEQQLKEYQKAVGGVHKADIGRTGVAIAAFSLGVSNMRKRKARTLFTCITLVILTFTVLSFTSVVSGMRFNQVPAPGTPIYQGLMIRDAMWSPLEESAYRVMLDEFGAKHAIAPRAWFFSNAYGEQSFTKVTGNKNTAGYDCKAIVGLTANEAKVTKVDRALACGQWLQPGDRYSVILPEAVAETLGINERNYTTATVRFSGTDFKVCGILNNNRFKGVHDLDREPLTPVDFIMMEKLRQQGKDLGEAGFREYVHLEPDNIVIVPYDTLINLGGQPRSIGMDFATKESVEQVLKALMPRLGMNIYAGMGNEIFRYSSIASTSITGIGDLLIPVLIAALIVLNTMLGSVFERIKEIHIFSSIGLAPSHVGILFMAEAFVYAVLGAIIGYLLGQITVKIIADLNLFQGLALNFSSLSAVFSTILVIFVVLGSTIYPSRKAAEVATPAIDRSWKVPEPKGDEWAIPLPFSVTGDQAIALNRFLSEWFAAYEEYSIGDFVTQNVEFHEGQVELGKTFSIELMAWLAPFDLGVSQHVELRTTPTSMEDVYELMLFVRRESGDVSNWKRVNRRFLNTLRKQFLIWRTLGSEDRERYLAAREAAAAEVGEPVA